MKQRRFWLLLVVLCLTGLGLGLGIGVYTPVYWEGRAQSIRTSRFAELAALRAVLERYAVEHGRYPYRLADAVEEVDVMPGMRLDEIEYDARGLLYPHEGNYVLFHEKTPRRYGSVIGWFSMSEDDWGFFMGQPQ
jgi:hypothetical protein